MVGERVVVIQGENSRYSCENTRRSTGQRESYSQR